MLSIFLYMYLFCIKLAIFRIFFGNPVQNRYTFFVPIKMYQFCTFFRCGCCCLNVIMITVNCIGSEQVSNLAVIIRQTVKNICMNSEYVTKKY